MAKAIQVNNLSKQYRLGQIGTGSLSHDMNRWWHSIRGKEDPYLKIGEANDRSTKGSSDYVWSLRDINFDIEQGDSVGIIGRNGAGKSTLLKILSRVTAPTTGSVKVKGRIASLLEVGTGFHPDLSGRDNIFLNGAILGMRKHEIAKKFDEIVDFAGVERYIDTPVKRYSSGMYVRLAFAVAAYLESEILIVDEVLAVGDAEFQKKCLGKMSEVSRGEGRTVLFVSHNMGMVAQLCNKSIILRHGQLYLEGHTKDTINRYLVSESNRENIYIAPESSSQKEIYFEEVKTMNKDGEHTDNFQFDESIFLDVQLRVKSYNSAAKISFTLQNSNTEYLSTIVEDLSDFLKKGDLISFRLKLPSHLITPNTYFFRLAAFVPNGIVYDLIEMMCPIKIFDNGTSMALFEGMNYGNFTMKYDIL